MTLTTIYKLQFLLSILVSPTNVLENYKKLQDLELSNYNPVIFKMLQKGMKQSEAYSIYLKSRNLNTTW